MNILIIGSKGFIGSHCVDHFSKQHNVWECDVVVDYVKPNYIQLDAANSDFQDLFKTTQFDVCINCSGAASVYQSIENPQRDFILNVANVFKQLDAIRKYNPNCKYVNFSSAAVYGNPKSLPITEQHPLNPISPYGMHKKMSEDICQEFHNAFGIKTCSLRVFSAYGEGLKKQLFWDLNKKVRDNNSVQLFGTGRESRDFIYISDLTNAMELVIEKSKFENDIINVANGRELFIDETVETFYSNYDFNVDVNFVGENRKGDPINWVADISKLQKLGYTQKVSLKDGLNNYYRWIKEEE